MVINGRKNMMKSKELSELLSQCIGTENYYKLNPFHLIYTDGVKMFAEMLMHTGFLMTSQCI